MNIFHISAECFPVAKVGGLADVVGALPKYQNKGGISSSVIMPFYNVDFTRKNEFDLVYSDSFNMDHDLIIFKILKLNDPEFGYDLYLVDIPHLLYTDYVYSHDDAYRFLAFQIASLEFLKTQEVDIIHCHDHHSGLVPFMMSYAYRFDQFKTTPSIFTMHNGEYHGSFSYDKFRFLPDFDHHYQGLLDWDGVINPLATAIKCAWRVTTVSPSYMDELKHSSKGLEMLIHHEWNKCSGILNGIDSEVWDPRKDPLLDSHYNLRNFKSGKRKHKEELAEVYNLNPEWPLFIFIGRLVGEKGADLIASGIYGALSQYDLNILILGSGEDNVEWDLNSLRDRFPGKYNTYIGYNEKLAHTMYAASDFILMPSRVEPCGLNQMYALRYGSIPIVSAVGGLKDTIVDIEDDGFGFIMRNINPEAIYRSIGRAYELSKDNKRMNQIIRRIMKIDHSWEASAKEYQELYKSVNEKVESTSE